MDVEKDLDWKGLYLLIDAIIALKSNRLVRSDLSSAIIALNVVATGIDGGEELDQEGLMEGARVLLRDLGYPVIDEEE